MHDSQQMLGRSVIQHGPNSDRVYLMKADPSDLPELVASIEELAETCEYTKLFAKVPAGISDDFLDRGFRQEAAIPGFYQGKEDGLFLCKYLDKQRSILEDKTRLNEILHIAREKARNAPQVLELPEDMTLISCEPKHTETMSEIYQIVFPSYPFPIHDPSYLRETMSQDVDYFGVVKDDRLVALSSAEMDLKAGNVEMTDFATLPAYRGQGLARCLLQEMETSMQRRGVKTAYTIARAASPGMNITFAQRGYLFGGLLVNNTQISGSIESMNVWYKRL